MFTFTVQCPVTNKLHMIERHNIKSASILQKQLDKIGALYQLHPVIGETKYHV